MKSGWDRADYEKMRELFLETIGMLQQSADTMSYYDAVRDTGEIYHVQDIFYMIRKRPFSFINPVNGLAVEIAKDYRSVLIKIRDGSTLGQDCQISSSHMVVGTTYVPVQTNEPKQCHQFWYNHVNGELTSIMVIRPNLHDISYTKKDGVWQPDSNDLEGKTLPKVLGRCKKLMGQPIPFRVDVFEQLEEFLQRSGFLDLHRDLENAWPCAKCRKPKKKHRGNAINGYEPMALS